ncbi:hypothetical protein [Paraburkholderia sp. XV]|uniref:hypothetical protein n=1 Tax=Paraburkholderia sp. XV TaxID=2831520 RepID=UPI001CD81379|nr:hypothetical protein [Paraburkholderia sp. XV]
MNQSYERTKYEAKLDVSYGQCWNALNERFFGRIDWIFGAITLLGGSAIVYTVTADHKVAAAWVAGVVAAGAILERTIGATEKKLEHRAMKARFADLKARSDSMSLDELDAELVRLQAEGPSGMKGLDDVAYNANVRTAGREDWVAPLNLWSKFLRAMA